MLKLNLENSSLKSLTENRKETSTIMKQRTVRRSVFLSMTQQRSLRCSASKELRNQSKTRTDS